MSTNERLRRLESALAARRPPATIEVDLVTCETREEALALAALPPTPAPSVHGAVRLTVTNHTAAEYLRQHGMEPTLPEPQGEQAP